MEPPPKKQKQKQKKEALSVRLARWDRAQLDHFYGTIDFVAWEMGVHEPEAHWYCRSADIRIKRCARHAPERTPMYYYDGEYYGSQRISLILSGQPDPVRMANIVTACGVENCVNPHHLYVQ